MEGRMSCRHEPHLLVSVFDTQDRSRSPYCATDSYLTTKSSTSKESIILLLLMYRSVVYSSTTVLTV